MAAAKSFNNIILGQFVLTGVPVKVYVSGRFLILTDADDIEDPLIGFGMEENGEMVQFSYPEVEFVSIQGNKVDIATYNTGMETLHSGDEAPADKEPEDETDEKDAEPKEDEKEEKPKGAGDFDPTQESYTKRGINMKLKDLLKERFQELAGIKPLYEDDLQISNHLEAIKAAMLKDDKRNGLIDYLEIQDDLLQIGYSVPEQGIKRWSADWNDDGIDFSGSGFKRRYDEMRPKSIEDVKPKDAYMLFVDTLSDKMVFNNYPAL